MSVPRLFALIALCFTLAGCGIRYGDTPDGNEFFKSLVVSGDPHAGSPLTAAVAFRQYYPTPIAVRCELRRGKDLVQPLGEDTVQSHPFGNPRATPFAGNFSYDFTVDTPGRYKTECFTPADEDNYIIKEFDVRAARPTPIATPSTGNNLDLQ